VEEVLIAHIGATVKDGQKLPENENAAIIAGLQAASVVRVDF
jgi:hypothetical protein